MDPSRSPRLNNIMPNPDSWAKDPSSLQRMSVDTTYCLDPSWRPSPIRSGIVPNYELAPDLEKTEILRVVVRENLTETLIDRLISDLASSKLPIFFSFPWFFFFWRRLKSRKVSLNKTAASMHLPRLVRPATLKGASRDHRLKVAVSTRGRMQRPVESSPKSFVNAVPLTSSQTERLVDLYE